MRNSTVLYNINRLTESLRKRIIYKLIYFIMIISILIIFSGCTSHKVNNKEQNSLINSSLEIKQIPSEYLNDQELSFLHVEGDKIVNEDGDEVILRGFQGIDSYPVDRKWYWIAKYRGEDMYKFDEYAKNSAKYDITQFDLNEIKSMGANVVRIWFKFDMIEKEPYVFSDNALDVLEETVNKFGEQGIYSILVLGDVGQNNFKNSWFQHRSVVGKKLGIKLSNVILWNNDEEIWDRSIALWGKVADRLKDNAYVAGYDLINEPQAPTAQALFDYQNAVIEEIRKYDKKHIVIPEVDVSKEEAHQTGGDYNDDNLAVSFHFYEPHAFTLGSTPNLKYPGTNKIRYDRKTVKKYFDKNEMKLSFERILNLKELKNKPIFVGEFGATRIRGNDGLLWIKDALDILNKRNIHFAFHEYKSPYRTNSYMLIKETVLEQIMKVMRELRAGTMQYKDLTEDQKTLMLTENGYKRREGLRDVLIAGFDFLSE